MFRVIQTRARFFAPKVGPQVRASICSVWDRTAITEYRHTNRGRVKGSVFRGLEKKGGIRENLNGCYIGYVPL